MNRFGCFRKNVTTCRFGQFVLLIPMLVLVLISSPVSASELTVPNSFTNGTTADADEVNENFTAAKSAVDDNYARLPLVWSSTDNATAVIQISTYVEPIETNTRTITVPVDGVVTLSGSVTVFFSNASHFRISPYIDGIKVPSGNVYGAAYSSSQNAWDSASYSVTVPISAGVHTVSQRVAFLGSATNIQIASNHLTISFLPDAQSSYNATP